MLLLEELENYKDLLRTKKVLVALSGGVDSMVLTYISKLFCHNHGLELFTLTVDHCLRDNSTVEAKKIAHIMQEWQIKHHIIRWDEGKGIKSNIEAVARKARYKILEDYAKEHDIGAILVAHHRDDQVENFFIRLTRGSGIDGLSTIADIKKLSTNLILIRPFLKIPKDKLLSFAQKQGITYFEDQTNQATIFLRNNIRKMLTNIVDKELLDKRILLSMEHFGRAKEFLTSYVEKKYAELVIQKDGIFSIEKKSFFELHIEIALRMLSCIFNKLHNSYYKPRFNKLLNLYNNIMEEKINKRTTFAHTLITLNKDYIVFSKEKDSF